MHWHVYHSEARICPQYQKGASKLKISQKSFGFARLYPHKQEDSSTPEMGHNLHHFCQQPLLPFWIISRMLLTILKCHTNIFGKYCSSIPPVNLTVLNGSMWADVLFGPLCIRPTILPFLCSCSFLVSMFDMWVYVFYGLYVGLAKLHCGATPPSVMVLFLDALASLRSKLRLGDWPTGQTQIVKITTESISDNEIGLCQYHKYQC